MSYKFWNIPEINKAQINALAEESGFDPFVTLLCYSRGYSDPLMLDIFLTKELSDLNPYAFEDMEKAVDRIIRAVEQKEKITIFGDYDCDGTTATALMYNFLMSLNADIDYYIPNRNEGYGMSISAVENIAQKGTKLIITVDNGIAAATEIARAAELGVDTVVTDHHLQQGELPPAVAVVDPHREDSTLDFKDFSGVGVAFMVALAVSQLSPEVMLSKYADLVALGTVADLMPLKAENRGIVAAGVKKLAYNANKGIKELLITSGVDLNGVNSTNLGFSVAPRINAAGRMGDAKRAVELMISDDIRKIQSIANELSEENRKRQDIEKNITTAAINLIEEDKLYNDRVIVLMGKNWHEGVLGIAAGRLTERYGKPVILLSVNDDSNIAKGSARSVGNFNLFDAISASTQYLTKFGGHDMAAGLSVNIDNIEDFRMSINQYAASLDFPMPELTVDCKLNPTAISLDLISAFSVLEPFGSENPAPVFGLFGMDLIQIMSMGNGKHLRLILSKNDTTVAAILFNQTKEDFYFQIGDTLDLAVALTQSVYQGEPHINVIVKDIKIHGFSDEKVLKSFMEYEEFISGKLSIDTAKKLSFEREEMAEIYRKVKEGKNNVAKLMYSIKRFSYSQISVIIDTLEELGLIGTSGYGFDRKITLCDCSKVNLENSRIYLNLKTLSIEG